MKLIFLSIFILMLSGCGNWEEEDTIQVAPKKSPVINFAETGFRVSLERTNPYTYGNRIVWNNKTEEPVEIVRQYLSKQESIYKSKGYHVEYVDNECPYDVDVYYFLKQAGISNNSALQGVRIPRIVVEARDDFSFNVTLHEYEWNKYKAQISWQIPFDGNFQLVKLAKTQKDFEEVARYKIPEINGSYDGDLVDTGSIYKYEIIYSGLRKFEEELPLNKIIQIPNKEKRLTINGKMRLSEIKSSESVTHLEFNHDAVLITDGKDISFDLRELKSNAASIMTFDETATGSSDMPGRNGGNIKIKAIKAIGDLNIVLRGEDAGSRTDEPTPLDESGRGASGATGVPGESVCIDSYPEGDGHHGRLPTRRICHCNRIPSNGEAGGRGHQGQAGNKGYWGGDSGNAEIFIEDGSFFSLTYDRIPGNGGNGSKGGLGGPGGHGGNPGAGAINCPTAAHGPNGETGPRGIQGQVGDKGGIGKICLKLSSDSAKYCF